MSLTDRINELRKDREHSRTRSRKRARSSGSAAYVARNDARREGESDEHWHKRRRRNRERYERRDEVVEHLAKKKHALQKEIDDLVEHKEDFKEEQRDAKDSGYDKGSSKIVTMDGKSIVEDLAYWLTQAREGGLGRLRRLGLPDARILREPLLRDVRGADVSGPLRRPQLEPRQDRVRRARLPTSPTTTPARRSSTRSGRPTGTTCPIDPVHMSRSGA